MKTTYIEEEQIFPCKGKANTKSMDAALSFMSTAEIAQSMQSTQLELAYERALRQAERIYEQERVRALRVQLLLLEDENDDLQEEAAENEDEQHHLEASNEELRAQVAEVEADLQQAQRDLKAQTRDLDYLRTEVNALNAASTDATKILAEKLALARELNTLKPELEHLKSQASTQQKLLSEKLALQRELSSVQVELETEKRAVQRIKAQEISSSREDKALTVEIEELKKELGKSQRDAQKTERENRKKTAGWENEKEVLEGKLDAFRNKLRSTKDQLKEAQDEIEKLQAERMAQSTEMTKARLNGGGAGAAGAANPRKRSVARFDPDMTIGTPGNGGPAAKKSRISVNVGDKSSFSITPFLNRTLSILPETPVGDEGEPKKKDNTKVRKEMDGTAKDTDALPKAIVTTRQQEKPSTTRKATGSATKAKPSQPLKESTLAKANSTMKKPQLAKLVEEDSDAESDIDDAEGNVNESVDKENTEHTGRTNTTSQDTTESLNKTRTLTKRTNIFDEEDNDHVPKIRGLGRGLAGGGRGGGGGGLGRISLKAKPVGKGKTLAEFSPLKKDRRATSVIE